ncbi:hypothetical protein GEV33_010878 [Tenebrio molitor]|uniref:Tc1-like transposase DDE domain-containing protein n=1 Tax=Tenebrio molitor TaxID=7067 RepID=A0A8J6L5S7_TENMO|nr:hypothetical protein GEV33_010878 [Tenebrio molitor]
MEHKRRFGGLQQTDEITIIIHLNDVLDVSVEFYTLQDCERFKNALENLDPDPRRNYVVVAIALLYLPALKYVNCGHHAGASLHNVDPEVYHAASPRTSRQKTDEAMFQIVLSHIRPIITAINGDPSEEAQEWGAGTAAVYGARVALLADPGPERKNRPDWKKDAIHHGPTVLGTLQTRPDNGIKLVLFWGPVSRGKLSGFNDGIMRKAVLKFYSVWTDIVEFMYKLCGAGFGCPIIKIDRLRALDGELPFNGGSIMWGSISANARTDLVLIDRSVMNGHRVVNEFLDEVGINRIEWPSRSPDLNPIEHVWDMIGKKVKARIPSSATLDEVFPVLQEKWDLLDDQAIMNVGFPLIESEFEGGPVRSAPDAPTGSAALSTCKDKFTYTAEKITSNICREFMPINRQHAIMKSASGKLIFHRNTDCMLQQDGGAVWASARGISRR